MFSPRPSVPAGTSPFIATPQGARSVQSKRVASVFTPQRKQNRSTLNRSVLQSSQLVEETSHFRIEKYGLPLPVLITEALTFADKSTRISVQFENSGWAWLVGGRKLFVWRYKQTPVGRNILCKELTLPPSDLAHSAARVCVIPSSHGDGQSASCIAVSPEGVVRYWSNIAYETSYMEISAELKGEECDSVVNVEPYGVLLATTTSSLVLITTVPGQNAVACRPIKAAHGMFAGIGRRMSSLIFGGGQGQTTGAALQAVVAAEHEEDERPFYVLSGTFLQKWVVGDYNMEKFLYQIDADRLFREALARKVWDQDSIQMTQLTTWLLDMQMTRSGLVLLGAGMNLDDQPVVHYALAIIATDSSGTPSKLENCKVLQHVKRYQEEFEAEILGYKLLVTENNGGEAYLYNDSTLIMDTGAGDGSPDELPAPGGRLLGAGVCDGTAVFFSIVQGFISISSTQKQDISILDDATQELVMQQDTQTMQTLIRYRTFNAAADLGPYYLHSPKTTMGASMSQIQELSTSEDKSSRLKAAFLSACSGSVKQAQEIVEELFPDTIVTGNNQSTEIDRLVTNLSQDLIDDYPASDPRWAENVRADSGSSTTSLIILQQLKDKQRAHEYIINFLKKLGLWDKLQTVNHGDHIMSTRLLLCQHAEQLEAAIVLREMHNEYSAVIDPAIRKVLGNREEHVSAGLSPHDIFYREVSHIHDIFEALLEYENSIMSGNFKPSDVITVISSINPIIESMLHAALQYRQNKAHVYQSGPQLDPEPEYVPWTSTSGLSGIRTLLLRQFTLTLEAAIPETKDIELRGQLFQQLLSLADNVLDGYSSQLASLSGNPDMAEYMAQVEDKFLQERRGLITPFLEYEQFERAASLAEKYCDFELLIRICEKTGNQERIQRYQQQFADKGFSDFLFSWYMKEGKRGRLLSLPTHQQTQLQSFLQKDEFGYLKWLHDIECQDFKSAHEILLELGRNEEQYLAKKKTLLSLSKLCALAYEEEEDDDMKANVRDIDEEQELILNQELLPAELIEGMNIDPEHMKVLSPVELIELYTCDENTRATEFDFKKALDLLQFLDKEDSAVGYEDIRTSIWGKALLRDKAIWLHAATGDPLEKVKDTVFCKCIDLAVRDGWLPVQVLPDKQGLLTSDLLTDISGDTQLQYLLGAVYEVANSGVE